MTSHSLQVEPLTYRLSVNHWINNHVLKHVTCSCHYVMVVVLVQMSTGQGFHKQGSS